MFKENKLPKIDIGRIDFSLLFFYLFIFAVPFMKRIELFSYHSFLEERFVEYLTYLVYGFDVLFVVVLLLWSIEVIFTKKSLFFFGYKLSLSSFSLLLFSFVSLFFASNWSVSLYYIFILE